MIALEVAALCGAGDRLHAEIDVAAANAERLAGEWGPDGPEDALPKQLARAMHGTVPQIAGAGLTAPIAYRWKTQINENAKTPASPASCPSSTTTRSRAGRARLSWAGSARCSSTTRTCIPAPASGSSSPAR